MTTERETVHQIINRDPAGSSNLFARHGALFHEGLSRFYGSTGMDRVGILTQAVQEILDYLRTHGFDDLGETFYNWIVRKTWCTFMAMIMKEGESGHVESELIFNCADPFNRAGITDEVRKECETHIASCEVCKGFFENSKDIPVDISHAGAEYPSEFKGVIAKVLEGLK